jgi:hypothetical protein
VTIQDTGTLPQPKAKSRTAAERRAARRKPTLWEGRLDTDIGVFRCVILNISQGGALVQLDAPLLATERATLTIERFGAIGAQIVWQMLDEGRLGVRFTDPPQLVARVLNGALPL